MTRYMQLEGAVGIIPLYPYTLVPKKEAIPSGTASSKQLDCFLLLQQ